MNANYKFEEELLKEYNFEPLDDGYGIDELKSDDRQQLSGMLWVLYSTILRFKANGDERYALYGDTLGKIFEEHHKKLCESLIDDLLCDIREFVLSCIDSYEEE